jgi:hypothetical protein
MTHTIVAHFPSHVEAERVVLELQKEGFDMQKLSIIGKDYQTTEHVRGFLTWERYCQNWSCWSCLLG